MFNVVSQLPEMLALSNMVGGPAAIVGNEVESHQKNRFFQTVSKVFQSVNFAQLNTWTAATIIDKGLQLGDNVLVPAICTIFPLTLGIPVLLYGAEKLFPNQKEKIETIQNRYSVALKIMNVAIAAFALATGLYWYAASASACYVGFDYLVFILITPIHAASLISNSYSLQKSLKPMYGLKANA